MPNAIAVDSLERKMYWGDARLDKIELVFLDTMERIVLRKAVPQHPFDIAIYAQFLFYTDWVQHSVIRVNKITGEDLHVLRENIPRPMSLVAISNQSLACETNPCSVLNGGCEDVCNLDAKGHIQCTCHPGRFLIKPNGKRCAFTRQKCLDESSFQCSQSFGSDPICIPYKLTCDGIR